MHAVVFHAPFDLRYEEVPTPTCPPGGILTKTLACGICGTDMRTYRGGSARAKYPGIFGHEIVAEVVESQYDAFPVGTRLSVDPIIPCGTCWNCRKGIQNQCSSLREIGVTGQYSGGFGESIPFERSMLENGGFNVISNDVDPADAALSETASSVLSAQINANIVMDDLVVIIGSGAIGLLHSEIAKIRGVKETLIVEMSPEKAELARSRGFSTVVNYNSGDPELQKLILEKTDGRGADVVICACPVAQVQADALNLVRKRGKVIFFGGVSSSPELNTNLIHYKEIFIYGANAYTPEVNRKALDLILSGQLDAKRFVTNRFELKDLDKGFESLASGKSLKNVIVY